MTIENSVIYRFLCISWVPITIVSRKNRREREKRTGEVNKILKKIKKVGTSERNRVEKNVTHICSVGLTKQLGAAGVRRVS